MLRELQRQKLVALAEYLGISIEETMAIGDNLNDVDI